MKIPLSLLAHLNIQRNQSKFGPVVSWRTASATLSVPNFIYSR